MDMGNGFVKSCEGSCGFGSEVSFTMDDVPVGSYYVIALVRIASTQGMPVTGDYVGIYGGTLANPPASPNAAVTSAQQMECNITLEPYTSGEVDLTGTWLGTISSSAAGTASLTLIIQQSGTNVTGSYSTGRGGSGTISAQVTGNTVDFELTQTTPSCTGWFSGHGTVNGTVMTFTFIGNDCLGSYTDGTGSVTKSGGGSDENVFSFNTDYGDFSASGNYVPPIVTGTKGAGWLDSKTVMAYDLTVPNHGSFAILMFYGSIHTGTFSLGGDVYFSWVLNAELTDTIRNTCEAVFGEVVVTSYTGSTVEGTFSGSGKWLTPEPNPPPPIITNGIFSIVSGGFNKADPGLPPAIRALGKTLVMKSREKENQIR
jgi:hypothetical protein